MDKNSITVTEGTLRDGRKKVVAELKKTTLTEKEVTLAQLLMEENFFRLRDGLGGGADFSVDVVVRSFLGMVEIRMTAQGPEYNPIPAVTEQDGEADEEEAYRLAILKASRGRLRYIRKGEKNILIINVKGLDAAKKQLIQTVSGLVLGTICGIVMHSFLDAATLAQISVNLVDPIRNLFLNALKMMMAPVTFFAIIAGVTNISDAALIGRLGGKMVLVSAFMQIFTVALGLGLALLLFSGDLSYMQAGITGEGATVSQTTSIKDMLFNIIPKNLVDPFKGDNILQVMFLAIFFGLIVNKMGDQAKGVTEVIDFLFRFMIAVLKVIVKAIPLIVFLSMATLLASTGVDSIIALSGLFGGLAVGVLLVWAVGALAVVVFGRMSPLPLTRKIAALSPLVFSISSSHARLPFVLKFCADRLGIDAKLAAFSIPVGVQLNKAGNCIFFSLATVMMMGVYRIELSASLLLTLWVSVFIMSVAKPPIPCGGIICIAYLFTVVGVPPEAISVIICVDPIAAMFNGVCNESSNITTSLILAKDAGMLEQGKYFSDR